MKDGGHASHPQQSCTLQDSGGHGSQLSEFKHQAARLPHKAPHRLTVRNSGRCLWILGRMVRAPVSRLSLASQVGTVE